MDNNKMVIQLDMFNLHQQVFLCDEEQPKLIYECQAIDELSEAVVNLSYKFNTYNIVITGNLNYCSSLIEDIKTIETKNFSQNFINIEVI